MNEDAPTREQIDTALDETVAEWLKEFEGQETITGWHLLAALNVDWMKIGQATIPHLSKEQSLTLIALSRNDYYAYRLASYIAAMYVCALKETGVDLNPELSMHGAKILTGEIQEPTKTGRNRSRGVLIKGMQLALCHFCAENSDLFLTRSREGKTSSYSACDAVAQAFCRAGRHTTYEQLVSLCYDKAHKPLREFAVHMKFMKTT